MNEGIAVVIALAVLAGGSIIVIDSLIIRKIRRLDAPRDGAPPPPEEDISDE